MSDSWEFRKSVKSSGLRRIVEDGNFLQSLIAKLDMQLSTGQDIPATETLSFIETTLSQMGGDCESLANVLNLE